MRCFPSPPQGGDRIGIGPLPTGAHHGMRPVSDYPDPTSKRVLPALLMAGKRASAFAASGLSTPRPDPLPLAGLGVTSWRECGFRLWHRSGGGGALVGAEPIPYSRTYENLYCPGFSVWLALHRPCVPLTRTVLQISMPNDGRTGRRLLVGVACLPAPSTRRLVIAVGRRLGAHVPESAWLSRTGC